MCVCVCVCLCVHLLHPEFQNIHSTSKVRTFVGSENVLAGTHNLKGLFKGQGLVLRLGLGLGLR